MSYHILDKNLNILWIYSPPRNTQPRGYTHTHLDIPTPPWTYPPPRSDLVPDIPIPGKDRGSQIAAPPHRGQYDTRV